MLHTFPLIGLDFFDDANANKLQVQALADASFLGAARLSGERVTSAE
jgi:hypothetical protein